MTISATIHSQPYQHQSLVTTNGVTQSITIAPKPTGFGAAVNGGELLLLALATCFCNDLYREAARKNIIIEDIAVDVTGEFGAAGEPGRNFQYKARVKANVPEADIRELLEHTDRVAEVHNTLRQGLPVTLVHE